MGEQAPAGELGVVELRAGVIHLHWESGLVVTEDVAQEVMDRVSALCRGRRRPLVVSTRWMEALGHRARNAFAATWPLTHVAVIGTTPVDKVIFVFYVARHRPVCPTQFFTSEVDALRWLKTPASAAKSMPVPGAREPVAEGGKDRSADATDPNEILDALLARVEQVIRETSEAAGGMPLFAVEAVLTERLRAVLPDARFTTQDIRTWSAQISS